jgi:nucleoid DNA-binding protein
VSPPKDDEAVKRSLHSVDILDYSTVVEKLADQQKLSEIKVRAVVRGLVALVADGLKSGKAVRIGGLGVLRVRDMQARAALTVGGKSHKVSKRVVLSSAKKFNIAVDLE